jgi:hypothetical protein
MFFSSSFRCGGFIISLFFLKCSTSLFVVLYFPHVLLIRYHFSSSLDLWKAYMKQARNELCIRLCDRLFDADGSKNKWWQVSDL